MRPTPFARRGLDQLAAGVLLEQVVDDLARRERPRRERLDALVAPADRRSERHAVRPDLARVARLLEHLEDGVRPDRVHARVVELVDVDVVGAEAREALLEGVADEPGRPVVRPLDVALALPRRVDVVAELRRDRDVVADVAERLCEQRLAAALAVGVGRVEERDAEVVRLAQERDRRLVGVLAPPAGRDRPEAEADLGGGDARRAERARLHGPECRSSMDSSRRSMNGRKRSPRPTSSAIRRACS